MSADLFDGQWQDVRDLVPPASTRDEQTGPVPDRRSARTVVKAEQRRADRHDAVAVWGEKRAAIRAERAAARSEARARRQEQRADRAAAQDRLRTAVVALAQRVLVVGPILAPMAVAWTGQSQFAIQILDWVFVASLLYAAAYELTTVYWAWLYHQARTDGDSGWEYRLATWVFAAGAAVQQWWHYSNHWHATPRAVTYSVMSGVGVLLWEGRARLLHRRKLRSEGKIPSARPRIGLVRWVRYPGRSWTAWSLTILEGHRTLDEAWTAADQRSADRRQKRAADRSKRSAVRSERMDRQQRSGPDRERGPWRRSGPGQRTATAAAVRTALPGPDRTDGADHRTTQSGPDHGAGPDRAMGLARTAGPESTSAWTGPDRRTGVDRTNAQSAGADRTEVLIRADQPDRTAAGPDGTGPRSGPDQRTGVDRGVAAVRPAGQAEHADRTETPVQWTAPARTADQTAAPDLVLTEAEREAVEILRSTDRTITKRNIAAVVRGELGRSIASERAAEIARHYRTLQAA
ncbi:hypothetical protein EDD38_7456 [Kitasatospora cineracea]|uniref:DUF2637 domain-containing protein n=2 Tax=Kitasatospora cineracea TaxID=88074 RepID=A0A3N4R9N1_9ACTN|nr:hypothetical protein EDD38_7456 [Kitasatospora cineracea]